MQEEPRVFISHSSDDAPLIRQIEAEFREAGIQIWVDHRGLRAGDNLPAEISEALDWCNILLLVWSKSSSQSNWVKLEWTNAVALHKRIIPLVLDETPLPSILSHKTYIRSTNDEERRAELLRALSTRGLDLRQGKTQDSNKLKPHRENVRLSVIKQLSFMVLVGAVLILAAALVPRMINGYLANEPESSQSKPNLISTGNADSHQKSTVLLLIVDFSSSMSDSQKNQVENNVNRILSRMPPSTTYGVYVVQPNWETPTSLVTEEAPISHTDVEVQKRTSALELARKESRMGQTSCLVNSLPFVQRFFGQYDPNLFEYQLIYLSDMIEDCRDSPVDRRLTLRNGRLEDLHFRETVNLSNVHITAIIPTTDPSQPTNTKPLPFQEVKAFWKEVFRQCGLSHDRLENEEWFYFSTFLPNRFK